MALMSYQLMLNMPQIYYRPTEHTYRQKQLPMSNPLRLLDLFMIMLNAIATLATWSTRLRLIFYMAAIVKRYSQVFTIMASRIHKARFQPKYRRQLPRILEYVKSLNRSLLNKLLPSLQAISVSK